MGQIKHEIKITDKVYLNKNAYYFDFSDYTEFTQNSNLYKSINGISYVSLPLVYGSFYRFKKKRVNYGLLHVVNIQKALGYVNLYVKGGNKDCLDNAIIIADNIFNLGMESSGELYLYNDYYQPLYMLKKDWLSGMAQGQYASLCILLFKHTSDIKYLTFAEKSINTMLKPVHEGGCSTFLNGKLWFEEYVNESRPSYVLNGNVFSILGLYDFYSMTGKFEKELNSAVSCLVDNSQLFFEIQNASRYDLRESICDASYNYLHEIQYNVLSNVFNEPFFSRMAEKFSKLTSQPEISVSFFIKKNYWRIIKLIKFLLS